MKRFAVATLGCRTNQYESQAASDGLTQLGYTLAQDGEEAEVCFVNTCTVTESADSASRREIRGLLRRHPKAKLVVTGCMAEKATVELQAMDERILVVPNGRKEQFIQELFPEELTLPEFTIRAFEGHTRAFVKVQDGCNSFCTYCIIPYVRGRSRSRSIGEIVREIEGLVAAGYKEVVLTGINIGDFDGGAKERLVDLVRAVERIEGLVRFRISSIDPDEVDEELADVVLKGAKSCPSMHIVLQSGSNAILKRMNRKYTRQDFLRSVEHLQKQQPDFTVTTDVIVGFPGETEEDFQETLSVLREVLFAKVHVFPYSARERTRAALYPHRIAPEVLRERKERLLRLAEETAFTLRNRFLGRRMQVLLERGEEGLLIGHTENFLKVFLPAQKGAPNDLVEVELLENRSDGLYGRVV